LDQGGEFRPSEVRVDAAAKSAIRTGNDVFSSDHVGAAHAPVGDDLDF